MSEKPLTSPGPSAGPSSDPSAGPSGGPSTNRSTNPSAGPLAAGRFPDGFVFGAATAAYQIEGAVREDGRGASIWDAFSHTPGKVRGGDTGDRACEHYHRRDADLDLVASLDVDAYRFSIAWPRVLPAGSGEVEARGLAFYDRLIDGCLERGLRPFATLYHWDLPLALERAGGWRSRDTAFAFADYAGLIASRFGDRLASVATFNEPWCSAVLGHLHGVHAPGHTDLDETLAVVHHQNLAHGLAVRAIRELAPELPVGIVLNAQAIYPFTDSAEDVAAAERHDTFHNAMWFGPLFEGRYPKALVDALGARLPRGYEDDLATIAQPLDWWGLNYYRPTRVTNDAAATDFPATREVGPEEFTVPVPVTDIGWEIAPATLTDCLTRLDARYALPPCHITENGACYDDGPGDAATPGTIDDRRRIDYHDGHLAAVADAMDRGVKVSGYFAWSLMDNFEWAEGYTMRFGLVHVDYETQRRTVKASGEWYRDFMACARTPRLPG